MSSSFQQKIRPFSKWRISFNNKKKSNFRGTIDGSEILRSPVEVGSLSRYLQSFITIQTVATGMGFNFTIFPVSSQWIGNAYIEEKVVARSKATTGV